MRIKGKKVFTLIKKALFLAFCLLLSAFRSEAQTWELGAFGGGAGYQGDLNQHNPFQISGAAAGIFIQRNINPYLSFKFNFTHGTIAAADSNSNDQQFRDRNLSFTNRINEYSIIGEFNFFKYTPGADFDHFTPFFYFGAGVVTHNPVTEYQNVEYALRPLTTEGDAYPTSALTIPYGIGFKYNFASSWNIMGSIGYRYVRTDYLDDVSGRYADPNTLTGNVAKALADRSGEKTGTYLGVPGTQRGDYRNNDTYMFIGISISFTILTPNCYYER